MKMEAGNSKKNRTLILVRIFSSLSIYFMNFLKVVNGVRVKIEMLLGQKHTLVDACSIMSCDYPNMRLVYIMWLHYGLV